MVYGMDAQCGFLAFNSSLSLFGFIFFFLILKNLSRYLITVNYRLFFFTGESGFNFCNRFGRLHRFNPFFFNFDKSLDIFTDIG